MIMKVFSVSEFIAYVNDALREAADAREMCVEGEVAEYRVSQDRFVWFKIKDADGVLDCFAMSFALRTRLEDGMKIRVFGTPRIFPKSGKFSINVSRVELVGEGTLKRAFELLKKQLAAEGLFLLERKRIIPRFPERIGLITSPEAAAYTDFLRILKNRWGGVEILLAPVPVQGAQAVEQIARAFRYFNQTTDTPEVLVLVRGGGSLEDLQAFNSEAVARAIFSSKIPVVVGVGHERDETIADYVADVRASTPSNAAERVVPDRREVLYAIEAMAAACESSLFAVIEERKSLLREAAIRFDHVLGSQTERLTRLVARLGDKWSQAVLRVRTRLETYERVLKGLDPRAILSRGYSIARVAGKIVKSSATVPIGADLVVQLAKGSLASRVMGKDGRSSAVFPSRREGSRQNQNRLPL